MNTRAPAGITPQIRSLCRSTGSTDQPRWVDCISCDDAQPVECFNNVRDQIDLHGGELIVGWVIWEWPGVLVEAELHAVWQHPDGRWLDPTPQQRKMSRVLFLPHPEVDYDIDTPERRVDNIRLSISENTDVDRIIHLLREKFRLEEDNSEGMEIHLRDEALDRHRAICQEVQQIQMLLQGVASSRQHRRIKRNDPCSCGSGVKYKRCCGK